MAKQLLTPNSFATHCTHEFFIKNYTCELLNLTSTIGKVELISTFTKAVCESWNVNDKYTWNNARDHKQPSMDQILKPGLHIVGRIAERICDDASKRTLKLSTYRLKIFLMKYQNL